MSDMPYHRMLAINAAAAGPYKIVGNCFDCGSEQAIVNFPRPFSTSIPICRRCRFSRTGIEDRRNLGTATATITEPSQIPATVDADFTIEDGQ